MGMHLPCVAEGALGAFWKKLGVGPNGLRLKIRIPDVIHVHVQDVFSAFFVRIILGKVE
jgi:hypothetical protein